MNQHQRPWDVQKILNNFQRNVAGKIIAMPLLPKGNPDTLIWSHSKSSHYDVKS